MAETKTKFDFTKLNTLSVVSLALSLGWVGSVAGVVTGHFALAQIKKSGEKGRGLAIAGLVLGYTYIALSLIWGAFVAGLALRGIFMNHNYGPVGGFDGMDVRGGWGMIDGNGHMDLPRGGGLVDPGTATIEPMPLPTP